MKKMMRYALVLAGVALLAVVNTGCTAKMKKSYHESRADKYYAAKQYDRAEVEYMNVLRLDNSNAKAYTRLGQIFFDQGRFQTAAPFLLRASMMATNDLEVRMKLGLIYAAAGKLTESRDSANYVLDHDPKSVDAPLLLVQSIRTPAEIAPVKTRLQGLAKAGDQAPLEVALGLLAFREGDTKAAEADFKRALTLDPKSADAYESLGALQASQNDLKNAEANFKSAADLAPARSTKRMNYARFKLQTGDVEGGRKILDDVVKEAPDYIPALMGLAEIALATKKFDESRANLTQVMTRDPDNFDGMMLDSRLTFAQGDLPGTVTTLERMAKIFKESPRVHFQLAAAYIASGDDTKAAASLNQALDIDPGFTEAVLMLSEIQIKNQNFDPAILALSKVVQKYPQLINAQMMLADAYRQRGRVADALAIYTALEKKAPNDPYIALVTGSTQQQAGNLTQARQDYEHVLSLAPTNLPALDHLVSLDLEAKNFEAARQRVQARIDQEPTNTILQLMVAKVQLAAGDRAGAEKTLLKVETMDPQSEQPYLPLAQLYLEGKQTDKAKEVLQTAISKNPKNLSAMLMLANMGEAAQDYKGAAAIYEKMLQVNPKYSAALNNLAYLYSEYLNQPDRAYELAQSARELLPFDPSTADTLGWICVKRGSYPTGLGLLQESVGKLSDVPEVQFHFGMANYMTLDEADARAAFQRALAGGKDFRGHDECQLCLALMDINPQTADAAAQAKLEKRVADKPEDPVAQGRLGMIYLRDGKADKATACFEAVLKTDARNVPAMTSLAKLYEANDAAKAYAMAKAAYKLAPNNIDATHVYGRLAYQNGDFKLASAVLGAAVQGQPGDATLQYDYARAAYSIGKVPVTQAALQAAMAANLPAAQAGEAKRMLDLIAMEYNPQASVAPQIEGILKAEPDYVPALVVQTKLKEQAGDAAAAAAACEKIIARFPDFGPAQRELAILYSKDSTKAKVAYSYAVKAREYFPDDPALAKATGIIAYQQGDYSRAATLLKDCAAKANTDAEIYYYLGAAQYKLKTNTASKASLQQAITLKISGALLDSAKQMLADMK